MRWIYLETQVLQNPGDAHQWNSIGFVPSVIFLLFGVPKIFGASAKNQSFFVPFRWFSPPQADFCVF